jgi:uncharacterized sulfatase
MLTRREFAAAALAAKAPAARPNILFCISDDQSYTHAGAYGERFYRTPAFDRVAREGVLFHNAYVSSPSCCPSRSAVLTGQDFYRLRETSMNHTVWPRGLTGYPDLLAAAGYHVGFTGKGWGPGNWRVSGRQTTPAGPAFNQATLQPPTVHTSNLDYAANLDEFLRRRPSGAPFCGWVGFIEPHREFEPGSGARLGKRPQDAVVPPFLPDAAEVRADLADYALEIEWYDRQMARILDLLERRGELDNTLIVMTADNGMAFPRAKGNLYDYGTRMPLAIRWGARARPGRVVRDFVSFTDFAPTFLEAAGVPIPAEMTGRSLAPLLASPRAGQVETRRDHAVFGIERHFPGSRPDGAGYPARAIRTRDWLYIRNLEPERNPVGDNPGPVWPPDDPTGGYGDTDGGASKTYLCEHRREHARLFDAAFGKRPAEELYDVTADPANLNNLAASPRLAGVKRRLAERLDAHLKRTADPRATGNAELLDGIMRRYPKLGANGETAGR